MKLLVALAAEARPLIDRLRLVRDTNCRTFAWYRGNEVDLMVCGVGKIRAAAAVAYLEAARGDTVPQPWLNIGIAGHRDRAIGAALVAARIVDPAIGKAWYPPRIAPVNCPSDTVISVDRAETDYGDGGAYDMEAAGFYPIASRFVTGELVQSLKIVSDNPGAPASSVGRAQVTALIAAQLDLIGAFMTEMRNLAARLPVAPATDPQRDALLAKWRFTVSEKHQLLALLAAWRTLAGAELPVAVSRDAGNAGQCLAAIEQALRAQPIRFSAGTAG